MPNTTKTTVSQSNNGQYQVTIPKALADALSLDGKKVKWKVESAEKLSLRRIDD